MMIIKIRNDMFPGFGNNFKIDKIFRNAHCEYKNRC